MFKHGPTAVQVRPAGGQTMMPGADVMLITGSRLLQVIIVPT
jgi:hypothetical protein